MLARLYLTALALVFALVAVLTLVAPVVMMGPLGVDIGHPDGFAELRAAYFGLFATAALVFGRGAWREEFRRPSLTVAGLVLGGFVAGRLLSLAVDGTPSWRGGSMLGIEATGLVLAVVLRGRAPEPGTPPGRP